MVILNLDNDSHCRHLSGASYCLFPGKTGAGNFYPWLRRFISWSSPILLVYLGLEACVLKCLLLLLLHFAVVACALHVYWIQLVWSRLSYEQASATNVPKYHLEILQVRTQRCSVSCMQDVLENTEGAALTLVYHRERHHRVKMNWENTWCRKFVEGNRN